METTKRDRKRWNDGLQYYGRLLTIQDTQRLIRDVESLQQRCEELERERDHLRESRDCWYGKAIERLEGAARALLTRKDEGPSEDAHIFAEWDDLREALAQSDEPVDGADLKLSRLEDALERDIDNLTDDEVRSECAEDGISADHVRSILNSAIESTAPAQEDEHYGAASMLEKADQALAPDQEDASFDPVALFRAERCAGESVEDAIETVARVASSQPTIPDGFRLLPERSTTDMHRAADMTGDPWDVWDSMVKAASQPPVSAERVTIPDEIKVILKQADSLLVRSVSASSKYAGEAHRICERIRAAIRKADGEG